MRRPDARESRKGLMALVVIALVGTFLVAGCSTGESADDFPPYLTFATVSYPVGVLPVAGHCSSGYRCLTRRSERCPAIAATCFTAAMPGHPEMRVAMVRYPILCHGVIGPRPNPPGTCAAIGELVGYEFEAQNQSHPIRCQGLARPSAPLPAGRVVGRVNGRYVTTSITNILCGLSLDDADRAILDRHLLMPQLYPSA